MVTEGFVTDDWRCPKLNRVVHNVNTARKFGKFTDVTFVVGSDEDACTIKAHRVVLGTANVELAKLVSGSDTLELIRIPDVSPKGFKNLIRFLYDIDVKFSDLSRVRETYLAASKFKVNKLKLAAENYLNQAVKYEPILEMLQIAQVFNMPKLQLKCIDAISTKYQDVLKSIELISAPFEVVAAVLSVRPCHGEDCQYQALLAIGKWMKKRGTEQTNLIYLLKCVDFTLIRMADFNDFIDGNEGLLSNVDIKAFQKYILSKAIGDAPNWYQSSEPTLDKKDCNTNTEAAEKKPLKTNFSQLIGHHKLKVKKDLDEELSNMSRLLTETADKSSENHKRTVNESVKAIIDYLSDAIKEAVETAVECVEDDLSFFATIEEEKNETEFEDGEKESIKAETEIVSASENDEPSKSECSTIKGSGDVPKSKDSVED